MVCIFESLFIEIHFVASLNLIASLSLIDFILHWCGNAQHYVFFQIFFLDKIFKIIWFWKAYLFWFISPLIRIDKNICIFILVDLIHFVFLTCNLYGFDFKKWHLVLIFFLRIDHKLWFIISWNILWSKLLTVFPEIKRFEIKKIGSDLVPINYVSTRKSNFRKSFSKRLFKTEVGWSLLKSWNRSTLAFDGKSFCCCTLGTTNNSKNKNTYQL